MDHADDIDTAHEHAYACFIFKSETYYCLRGLTSNRSEFDVEFMKSWSAENPYIKVLHLKNLWTKHVCLAPTELILIYFSSLSRILTHKCENFYFIF